MPKNQDETFSPEEAAKRRDEVVRKMANTPPQPRVGEAYVGRVYLVTTAGTNPYWGFFPAKGAGSGKAPSRREAMLEVEKWWRL